MNFLKQLFVEKFLNRRVSPIGLSIFRIAYSLVLIWEAYEIFFYRHLIFENVPFERAVDVEPGAMFIFWMMSLCALLVGWKTRAAAAVNFACSLFTFASFNEFEYHFDHVAHTVNFVLVFLPVSEMLSVDHWLKSREDRTLGIHDSSRERDIHPIYYYALMLTGIGLLYLDSATWKVGQPAWREGYAIWRPMSLPPFTWFPTASLQFMLNQKWLMIAANYLTLFLEFGFILFMWSRRCRLYILFPIGLVLHFGILLAFPIPKFSFVMLSLYIVVVPPDLWHKLRAYINRFLDLQRSESNAPNSLSANRPSACISVFNRPMSLGLVAAYMLVATITQGILIAETPTLLCAPILSPEMRDFAHKSIGSCNHGVFLDAHWDTYHHVVAIVEEHQDGSYEWLPFTTESGQMGSYATDRMWAKWAFRANSPLIDNPQLERSLKQLTKFWCVHQGREVKDVKFVILTKVMYPTHEWAKDRLEERMNAPWQIVGNVKWQNDQCTVSMSEIEQIAAPDPHAEKIHFATGTHNTSTKK